MGSIQPVVGASSDACHRSTDVADYFSLTEWFAAGYYSASFKDMGSAARFLNVTIPAGATITLANCSWKLQELMPHMGIGLM